MAKASLALLKKMTIPRLELLPATLAVRQDGLIRREIGLEIEHSHFWIDSMIFLQYICNKSKRFHTFVANRVEIILSGSELAQWHHINTNTNVADDASRGLSAAELLDSERWLMGPSFLVDQQCHWPVNDHT